ncbi:MAG TPA: hypothetical protein VNK95_00760 [Caldilineaceae bacterium]|nr:hypothetical protein [Caldilineaceae bacterium]
MASTLWRFIGAGAVVAGVLALARWYRQPAREAAAGLAGEPAPSRLDEFLPEFEFGGIVSTIVHAPPHTIFQALREVTLDDMPVARFLGELRYLPGRLSGKAQDIAPASKPFMELVQSGAGNIVLAEEADRELVLGAVGKFHNLMDQQVVPLNSAGDFLRFDQPDYQKLAMSIRVVGTDPDSGYRLTLEHRTHALSKSARRRFALYWLGIKPGGNLVSWLMLRAVKRRAEAADEAPPVGMERPPAGLEPVGIESVGVEGDFDGI